jgi:hypothetical protein
MTRQTQPRKRTQPSETTPNVVERSYGTISEIVGRVRIEPT